MKTTLAILIRIIILLPLVLASQALPETSRAIAAGPWYVSTTGNDSNNCFSAAAPCRTINVAIGKAASGDTILVASGTYTGTLGSEAVVTINNNLSLSGGWNETFTTQADRSTIDGENTRSGISVPYGPYNVSISRFVIQGGHTGIGGGGISVVHGTLSIENSVIKNNYAYAGGGGIAILSYSTVYIRNSAITGNTSPQWGGGIFSDYSEVTIVNSTISGNFTNSGGGGIVRSGPNGIGYLHTYNVTISNNTGNTYGGGIWGAYNIILNNTILAGNHTLGPGPDCYLPVEANIMGSYNLIGDSSGCDFIPTTGDLVDIDPLLGALQDNGGDTLTQALLPGSLAIDHGDPAGCIDDMTNYLTSDQRGFPRYGRCDIGAYEWQPPAPGAYQIYLPCVSQNCGPIYSDNFSNPSSGWFIYNDSLVTYQYLNNEYRILLKATDRWAGARSPITASDYIVVADVRNATGVDGTYGLIFGLSGNWSQFYSFEIDLIGEYAIWRYEKVGETENWDLLAFGYLPDFHSGSAANQLEIRRVGSRLWAFANGELLNVIEEGSYTGPRYTGLIAFTYIQPNLDVRYDNFGLYPSGCGRILGGFTGSLSTDQMTKEFDPNSHMEGRLERSTTSINNP